MKLYIIFLIFLLIPFSLSARTIVVKYRDTPVDVDNGQFEELKLKPSSLVKEMFYDEEGDYHDHDPNTRSCFYTCSNGHQFWTKSKAPCPNTECDFGTAPETVEFAAGK